VLINRRFSVPKFVDIDEGSLELLENVTGVRFFETQCMLLFLDPCGMTSVSYIARNRSELEFKASQRIFILG